MLSIVLLKSIPKRNENATVDHGEASNAETQALRNLGRHKVLRIMYTISEVVY
jgi:hypothetical protein